MSEEKREIEIIPPGEDDAGRRDDPFAQSGARIWVSNGGETKFVRLGPFQGVILGIGLLLFVGLCLFFLSGVLLVMAPVVALIGAGAWIANKLGVGPFKSLR